MSVALYEYYSEKAENDLFISEVSRFNTMIETEFLFAESGMMDKLKGFIRKIFEFIKKIISKIVSFFTGKKSSGGGGGGGGGGGSPSPVPIAKAAKPEDILVNEPKYAPIVEALGEPKVLVAAVEKKVEESKIAIEVVQDNLSALLNKGEGIKTIINKLEEANALWSDKDIEDMRRVLGRASANGVKRLEKARLAIDAEKFREVILFTNQADVAPGGAAHDPKALSLEFYNGIFEMTSEILKASADYSSENITSDTKSILGAYKNSKLKNVAKLTTLLDTLESNAQFQPLGGIKADIGKKICEKIFSTNVATTIDKKIGKDAEGDDIFIYPPKDSKNVPFMFNTKISNFFLSFFPFLGIFDIEKGVFTRKPIDGYGNADKSIIDSMMTDIDKVLDNLNKDKEGDNGRATAFYSSRKDSIMYCMRTLNHMLDMMNYGDIVYGPAIEKIYLDIVANDGTIIKAANEQLVVQAINVSINKSISDLAEKVNVPQQNIINAKREALKAPVEVKVEVTKEKLLEGLKDANVINAIKEIVGENKKGDVGVDIKHIMSVTKKLLNSVDDEPLFSQYFTMSSKKGVKLYNNKTPSMTEHVRKFASQSWDVINSLLPIIPKDAMEILKFKFDNIKDNCTPYKVSDANETLRFLEALFYVHKIPLSAHVVNTLMSLIIKSNKRFGMIYHGSKESSDHDRVFMHDNRYSEGEPWPLLVYRGELDKVNIKSIREGYFPIAEGAAENYIFVAANNPGIVVVESE